MEMQCKDIPYEFSLWYLYHVYFALKSQFLKLNFFQLFLYSFNIAIKSNRYVPSKNLEQNGMDSCMGALMEEAKNMLEVGSYHENIVNLQGVTCVIENGVIHQVPNT